MQPFSDLLSEHIEQAGISDAELARRLGVSRQTIFRWREGETQRPRHRDDVVRLATTLKLSTKDRDQLLTAAGFPPERQIQGIGKAKPEPTEERDVIPQLAWRPRILVIAGLSLAALVVLFLTLTPAGERTLRRLPWHRPAAADPGETLIVVSPFQNYGGAGSGYNVAGRVKEAIQSAFNQAEVVARVEVLASEVTDESQAQEVANRLQAALVIWGEYDSGRILAYTTGPAENSLLSEQPHRWYVATTDELAHAINRNVPAELGSVALTILGQVQFQMGHLDEASNAFRQALEEPPTDERSQAAIYYYLGLVESQRSDPSQTEIITYYTEAIELRPELVSAINNRGLAYLERGQPGDIDRAQADFAQSAQLAPDLVAPVINMAAALQLQAEPEGLDDLLDWLERAQELMPTDPAIQNDLCWYYSLDRQPQVALPHCDRALELGDLPTSHDSRGLTLALLGRYEEAIQEFRTYLSDVKVEDPAEYDQVRDSRQRWIEILKDGQNPISEAVLQELTNP